MSSTANPPTARQLRYLRDLALQRGETFAYPASAAEAHAEIDRLRGRPRACRGERRAEDAAVSRAMDARGDAAAVRDSELTGYGSSARWR